MKTVAVILSRMGSSRLPGKALMDICGKCLLERVIDRVKLISKIDDIVLATSTNEENHCLESIAASNNVKIFRGSENDVLDRFYNAARSSFADNVIYVGGDCPLLMPDLYDDAIDLYFTSKASFVTNLDRQTLPEGCDIAVISIGSLKKIFAEAELKFFRTNIFSYVSFCKTGIEKQDYSYRRNYSRLHWSVDYKRDLEFCRRVYQSVENLERLGLEEVVARIAADPELSSLQEHLKIPVAENALLSSEKLYSELQSEVNFVIEETREGPISKSMARKLAQAQSVIEMLAKTSDLFQSQQ